MAYCSLLGCNSTRSRNRNEPVTVTFLRFPKDEFFRNKWLQFVNRPGWLPSKNSVLCSEHFVDEDLLYRRSACSIVGVRSNAVPCHISLLTQLTRMDNPASVLEESVNVLDDPVSTLDDPVLTLDGILINEQDWVDALPCEEQTLLSHEEPLNVKKVSIDKDCQKEDVEVFQVAKRIRLSPVITNEATNFKQNYRKTIVDTYQMIKELERERMISCDQSHLLLQIDVKNEELFNRPVNEHPTRTYSSSLRTFAMTLNFYSPQGYRFLQENFDVNLPELTAIETWFTNEQGKPGFTKEAFAVLKRKVEASKYPLICNLVLGQMEIKRHVELVNQKYYGFIDYGADFDDDSLPLAKEALVFMVVCINNLWSLPVAYFLLDAISGEQKSILVTDCLNRIYQTGIQIVSITVDDCTTDFAMLDHLGCSMKNENLKSSFTHPTSGEPVQIFLNPTHMFKLVQNAFESSRIFIDENNEQIDWSLIEKSQFSKMEKPWQKTEENLRYAPQPKMNFELSFRLFKDTFYFTNPLLEYCSQLKVKTAAPTIRFVRIINYLFQLFNSPNMVHYDSTPLNEMLSPQRFSVFDTINNYLKNLKFNDGNSVLNSNRKTGFLGLRINILSYKAICEKFLGTCTFRSISFRKFTPYPLAHFFYTVSSQSGKSITLTSRQFQSAYKEMLVHLKACEVCRGNYNSLEQIEILNCYDSITKINRTILSNEYFDEIKKPIEIGGALDPFGYRDRHRDEIVTSIAGYVSYYLYKKIQCQECLNVLHSLNTNPFNRDLFKTKSGFLSPSRDVVKICVQAEKTLKEAFHANGGRKLPNLNVLQLARRTLRCGTYSGIFDCLFWHAFSQNETEYHKKSELIRNIIEHYLVTRINFVKIN